MNKNGSIVIVEDDEDDQALLQKIFSDMALTNAIIFLNNGKEAYDYLESSKTVPFIIICDINMPQVNGFDLRKAIRRDAKMELRCIPFLYLTTSANEKNIREAYNLSIQGYFIKPANFSELKKMIKVIIEYWTTASSPKTDIY